MGEKDVLEAKRLRHAARQVFDTQREMVRADLDAAGVGKRVTTKLVSESKTIAEEAADVASSHRALVTIGALALTGWFLRGPIGAFAASLFSDHDDEADEPVDTAYGGENANYSRDEPIRGEGGTVSRAGH